MCRFIEVEHSVFMEVKFSNLGVYCVPGVMNAGCKESVISGHRRYSVLDLFEKELAFFTSKDFVQYF